MIGQPVYMTTKVVRDFAVLTSYSAVILYQFRENRHQHRLQGIYFYLVSGLLSAPSSFYVPYQVFHCLSIRSSWILTETSALMSSISNIFPSPNPSASLERILLRNYTYQQYEQDCLSPQKNSLVSSRNVLHTIW